jgi:hypothetical protein
MVYEQIERLLRARPFQPFEMLLSDQRKVTVANLDFASLLVIAARLRFTRFLTKPRSSISI